MFKYLESEQYTYKGEIIAIANRKVELEGAIKTFEYAVRSPGVRVILLSKDGKILLTTEYRHELDSYDYRLPGGMVFDTLDEYLLVRQTDQDVLPYVETAAKKESLEEIGHEIGDLELIHISKSGSKIIWDLYYFVAHDHKHTPDQHQPEAGEQHIEFKWVSKEEAKVIALGGEMKEDRSVSVLLRYLNRS